MMDIVHLELRFLVDNLFLHDLSQNFSDVVDGTLVVLHLYVEYWSLLLWIPWISFHLFQSLFHVLYLLGQDFDYYYDSF